MNRKRYLLFRSFYDLKRSYQDHCGIVHPVECCVIDDDEMHNLSLEDLEGAAVVPFDSVITVFPFEGNLRRVHFASDLRTCSVEPTSKKKEESLMAKLSPYFFKISTDPKDPWYSLGCFHNSEEAFMAFKKKYGEKDVHLIRGKSYYAINGKLMED